MVAAAAAVAHYDYWPMAACVNLNFESNRFSAFKVVDRFIVVVAAAASLPPSVKSYIGTRHHHQAQLVNQAERFVYLCVSDWLCASHLYVYVHLRNTKQHKQASK